MERKEWIYKDWIIKQTWEMSKEVSVSTKGINERWKRNRQLCTVRFLIGLWTFRQDKESCINSLPQINLPLWNSHSVWCQGTSYKQLMWHLRESIQECSELFLVFLPWVHLVRKEGMNVDQVYILFLIRVTWSICELGQNHALISL